MPVRVGTQVLLLVLASFLTGCSNDSDGGVSGAQILEVGLGGGADYASIQDAVDAAATGAEILIQPGVYAEAIVVTRSVTLAGSGPGTVVEYPAGGPPDAAVIEVRGASEVRIETLSVRGFEPEVDGLRVRDATAVVLDSIVASNNTQDGIDVRRSSAVQIVSGTLEGNGGDGLQLEDCNGVSVLSSRSASNAVDGVKVELSGDVLLEGSEFVFNDDDGILVRDSSGVELTGNTSTDNGGWGVSVNSSPDTVLDRNTVEDNGAGDVKCEPIPCTGTN
jgi:parallel beta-helix repeat protein